MNGGEYKKVVVFLEIPQGNNSNVNVCFALSLSSDCLPSLYNLPAGINFSDFLEMAEVVSFYQPNQKEQAGRKQKKKSVQVFESKLFFFCFYFVSFSLRGENILRINGDN